MKKLLLACCCLLGLLLSDNPAQAQTQTLYFPSLTGSTWASTTPASLGWCQPQLDSLLAFAGRKGSKSLLILKDGRMVVEQYYGTYTADSVWYWASAGKSLTATLVGLAQQDGILSLNDSTSRYLGRWTSATRPQQRQITIRHQLTMTTGLDDTPPAPCDNESTTPSCLRYLAPSATRWAYHTGAYRTLQDVLTQASGASSMTQYTNQRLGNRIGMTGVWVNDVYYSKARSMARFGLFILARGAWNGTQIMTDGAYFQAMTTPSQTMNRSYGYLWWVNGQASYKLPGSQLTFSGSFTPAAPADMIAALGKNDQKIYVVPSLGLVVVRQGQSAGQRTLAASSFDNELWTKIMAVFCRPMATAASSEAASYGAFPNPAVEILTLRQPAPTAVNVRLLDALGCQVRRQPTAGIETSVSVAALAPGLYTVQWLDAAGRVLASRRVARL
ncbi:serine hydrolase domain-containing protein [Hymenobacter monticola]|uniref:Beta-lactamase family protein n=1 Tax=Hymenobacter monticola TaxID=1705399 RepID=A0ABY4BD44_9BACT|nr:serine hydrolase domain-containing protein [Hymenobacter monticola]UOE35936.1 beta-lactamase family protein [Hymenobacter monticola]